MLHNFINFSNKDTSRSKVSLNYKLGYKHFILVYITESVYLCMYVQCILKKGFSSNIRIEGFSVFIYVCRGYFYFYLENDNFSQLGRIFSY